MNTLMEEKAIEYLKSGISINTQLGCNIGCKYCIVGEFQKIIEKTFLSDILVKTLIQHRFYHMNIPIFINNRSEPLLNNLKYDTLKILKILKDKHIKNPKIIISKLTFGDNIDYDLLNNNNVFLFRTLSGMPKQVEPTSTNENLKKIVEENKLLKKYTDIKIVQYWRPIVRGLNSDSKILEELFIQVNNNFDGSVVSGIRLTHNLKKILEGYGANFYDWNGKTDHKFLPLDIWNDIKNIKDKINKNYLLFRNTSCAISYFLNKSDYNLNYLKEKNIENCKKCLNYNNCFSSKKIFDKNLIIECLNRIGRNIDYKLNADVIEIYSDIYQDELSFIKQVTGYKINAKYILKSGSEKVLNNV